MEEVALWMIRHGYATGHGGTLDDMLAELVAQVREKSMHPLFRYDPANCEWSLVQE